MLGLFPVWTIINNTAVNVFITKYLCTNVTLLRISILSRIAESNGGAILLKGCMVKGPW
jgi:hypothetical protein